MSIEEVIYNQFCKAKQKKIWIEDIHNKSLRFNPDTNKSLCFFNNKNNTIHITNKCNHIFVYNCNNINFTIKDCISGITIINSQNCNIFIHRIPNYMIEVKSSDVIIRCHGFLLPLLFYDCHIILIKQLHYIVQEYVKITTNIFQEWSYNYFNF